MKLLLLGAGKTGALVAEAARERGHEIETLRSADNPVASALTRERLAAVDVVIDFTTPHCVLDHIHACMGAGKNMVVGTTGWYSEIPKLRTEVEQRGVGFVFGSNFSIGVNLFFDLVRAAAPALQHQYFPQIYERHHAHKKDAPSGTAVTIQKILQEASNLEIDVTSFREGEVVGMHEVVLESPADTIYLCHDAKSRRGFAEGAVRAAEWIAGKKGFYEFKDIWREIK
ncbi:MAG TPA: dihydrodipicolinate reductase C-terminal domain-containing protein [Terriglobales bacterium]|nr:dihydrodipicolinate reductase C-terminal domain-containing protein [Terriglobales bacterium]